MEAVFKHSIHEVKLSSAVGNSCSDGRDTCVTYSVAGLVLIDCEKWTLKKALDLAVLVTASGFQRSHLNLEEMKL